MAMTITFYEMEAASFDPPVDIRSWTRRLRAGLSPNGDIVFSSTRCVQQVDCFTRRLATRIRATAMGAS